MPICAATQRISLLEQLYKETGVKLNTVALSLTLVAGILSHWARAQADVDIANEIERQVLSLTDGGFWGTIVVARGDEELYRGAFGLADYRSRLHSENTRYEIASVSKQFVSVAIFRLAEQGLLDIHDPIGKHFPSLSAPHNQITIYQLLTHTSGLPSDFVLPYNSTATRDELIRSLPQFDLIAEPGTMYVYCNGGYAVLAALIESVSGVMFEQYMKDEVFSVAGLEHTGFVGQPVPEGAEDAHRLNRYGYTRIASDWHSGWGYKGMGGIVATADDLVRWMRALKGDRLLQDTSREMMWKPAPVSEHVACGWILQRLRGQRAVTHGGSVEGFVTLLTSLRDEDLTIAILTNQRRYVYAIQEIILEQLVHIPKLSAVLDARDQELSEHEAVKLRDQVGSIGVRIAPDQSHIELRILNARDDSAVATVNVPFAAARYILNEADALGEPSPSTPPGLRQELGVYFHAYEKDAPVQLDGLKLEIRPGSAKPGVPQAEQEPGMQIWINHEEHMFTPIIIRLGHRGAYQLAEQLRANLPEE